ncbi:M1 family aminopeptidase [Cystobacter fuscus]
MARQLMFLAHYGKTTLREKKVGGRWIADLPGATPHLTLGYTTFSPVFVADKLKAARRAKETKAPASKRDLTKLQESLGFDKKRLWANTVFPATDGENWLVSGTAAYWNQLHDAPDEADKVFEARRDALAELNARYLYLTSREEDVVPVAARTSYGRYGTYAIPRIKGTFLLHQLRLLLGNESFAKVMRTVHERYAQKNITTKDFVRTASEVAGRDLTPFVSQWVERAGLPAPRLRASVAKAREGHDVTLEVEQGGVPYHFVTAVELVTNKGSVLERVEVKGARQSFTFHVAERPVRVVFNPTNDIPVPREHFQVLSNALDDFSQLLFVHGTARGVEAGRTLALEFRDTVADAFTEQLSPLKPDAEVTEAELAGRICSCSEGPRTTRWWRGWRRRRSCRWSRAAASSDGGARRMEAPRRGSRWRCPTRGTRSGRSTCTGQQRHAALAHDARLPTGTAAGLGALSQWRGDRQGLP